MVPSHDKPSLKSQLAELLGDDDESGSKSPLRRPSPKRLPIAQALKDCAIGNLVAATGGGQELVVAHFSDGRRQTFLDQCPHDGGLLSDGYLEGQYIVCSRHNWEFDGKSGRCRHDEKIVLCYPGQQKGA